MSLTQAPFQHHESHSPNKDAKAHYCSERKSQRALATWTGFEIVDLRAPSIPSDRARTANRRSRTKLTLTAQQNEKDSGSPQTLTPEPYDAFDNIPRTAMAMSTWAAETAGARANRARHAEDWHRIQRGLNGAGLIKRSVAVPKCLEDYEDHLRGFDVLWRQPEAEQRKVKYEGAAEREAQRKRLQQPFALPFGGATDHKHPCVGVLGHPTIWTPTWHPHDGHGEAKWPSRAEWSWEGDERMTSSYQRFTPIPKVPNQRVSFKEAKLQEPYPFDFVHPTARLYPCVYLPGDPLRVEPEYDEEGTPIDDENDWGRTVYVNHSPEKGSQDQRLLDGKPTRICVDNGAYQSTGSDKIPSYLLEGSSTRLIGSMDHRQASMASAANAIPAQSVRHQGGMARIANTRPTRAVSTPHLLTSASAHDPTNQCLTQHLEELVLREEAASGPPRRHNAHGLRIDTSVATTFGAHRPVQEIQTGGGFGRHVHPRQGMEPQTPTPVGRIDHGPGQRFRAASSTNASGFGATRYERLLQQVASAGAAANIDRTAACTPFQNGGAAGARSGLWSAPGTWQPAPVPPSGLSSDETITPGHDMLTMSSHVPSR